MSFPPGNAAFQQKNKKSKCRTLVRFFRGRLGFNEYKSQEQNQSRGSIIPGKGNHLIKGNKVEKSNACSGNDNQIHVAIAQATEPDLSRHDGEAGPQGYLWHGLWNQNTPGLSPDLPLHSYVTFASYLISLRLSLLSYEVTPSTSQGCYKH